jgi:signal peptidase I
MTTRTRTLLRETALTIGAGLGLVCLFLAVAAPLLGIRLLVFESGSMSPTVETGGLAVTRTVAADDLAVGDIVSVTPTSGQRITHRIVAIDEVAGQALLTLRGDANPAADPEPYPVTQVDRVVLHVDGLGFVVRGVASPYALLVAGFVVAGLLALAFRRKAPLAVAAVIVTALAGGALLPTRVLPTLASFTDTAPVTTGALTTTTVPKPGITGCTVTGGLLVQKTATIVWTEVGPWDYAARISETGASLTVTDNGSTRQAQFSAGLLSAVLNATYHVEIWARPASGTWTSAVSTQPVTIALLGLGLSCGTAS